VGLQAGFLTGFIVTGAFLSQAYIGFEYTATLMERELDSTREDMKASILAESRGTLRTDKRARAADDWWRLTQAAFVLTVTLFLISIWWPVFS
jgi:hypothetical protein